MLRYNVRGENIEVTQAIREYVEKKVSKIEKYFNDVPEANAHVNLKTYSDKTAKVEVTVPLPYVVLRAEETSPDLYGSVDLVVDKLERQMRKYKTKINRKNRRTQGVDAPQPVAGTLAPRAMGGGRTKPVKPRLTGFAPGEEGIEIPAHLGQDFFTSRRHAHPLLNPSHGLFGIVVRRASGLFVTVLLPAERGIDRSARAPDLVTFADVIAAVAQQ